jgi:hypothetical protein
MILRNVRVVSKLCVLCTRAMVVVVDEEEERKEKTYCRSGFRFIG